MNELCRMTATEAVARLRRREIKPIELVEASIERILQVDGTVNPLPIHCFECAREQAERLANANFTDNERSLCGLPIGVKDYNDVGGVRTTYGSPIFADPIADRDALARRCQPASSEVTIIETPDSSSNTRTT